MLLAAAAPVQAKQASSLADVVMAIPGDRDYGAYLAGECLTCHQVAGHAQGVPSIVGLPREEFIRALLEYRNNLRRNEVMKLRVSTLGDEEIAALAAYFSSLSGEQGDAR
jgi:cytochrome c